MGWNLIDAIRRSNQVDARLVRPFGLALQLGDVVSVQSNGNLSLQGSCRSLLGIHPTPARQGPPGDLLVQSASGASISFRAAGVGSTLYPELPSANACFDVELANEQSWLLACRARTMHSLTELNSYRPAILNAHQRGVWQTNWALVVEIGMVDRITLLAANSRNTKLTLSVAANVTEADALEARLTADVSVAKTNSALVQLIMNQATPAFCNAVKVKESWFSDPDVVSLESLATKSMAGVTEDEFWQELETNDEA